jgi:hypothetical protein
MIPARIIHLDAKGSTHAPPHRAVSFAAAGTRSDGVQVWQTDRVSVGERGWRLSLRVTALLAGNTDFIDVWLVNGQRVRVRPSAKWLEARKEMFK